MIDKFFDSIFPVLNTLLVMCGLFWAFFIHDYAQATFCIALAIWNKIS